MSDLTRLTVWDDPAICGALSWYMAVAENRRPAKFRIAATVATKLDPAASGVMGNQWTWVDFVGAQVGRYVRFQLNRPAARPWSIGEVNLYN